MTKRFVFLDPDGTSGADFGVIVEHATGVLYATQCGGLENIERAVEGYFVPLGGAAIDAELRLDPMSLRKPFHNGSSCAYGGAPYKPPVQNYTALPGPRLEQLIAVVATIPWWSEGGTPKSTTRQPLVLDESRLSEILESWVPVITADGPGVLIWPNCD